jgi:cytosine/adenosine deaminase-related metal-dependent hydrolase
MKTLIQGGHVVAYDGKEHRMISDGVVVYEDDRIIYVGTGFEGEVDRTLDARGKLVSPGFINIHALASICITHLRVDRLRGQLTSDKAAVLDGLRNPRAYVEDEDAWTTARFCFAELLKGGGTTSVAITAFGSTGFEPAIEQAQAQAAVAGELGARAYISHPYLNAKQYKDPDGGRRYYWDEDAGRAALEKAIQFAEAHHGTYDDRIRTMLFPYQFETCSAELLRETKRAAQERDLIVHMHTSQYLSEFHESFRRYGRTPVQYLYDTGFLDPNVILTHVLYTTLNPMTGEKDPFPKEDKRDIELLARSGVTVAHCPLIYSRGGRILHSFGQYQRAGINMTIGTDAFPMDMILEMRHAAILGKVAERDPLAVTARDVFNAATLAGAKALGRDDLGRLASGAKADILIVDLTQLHMGLIDDPIKTLIYMGSQRDIETVIVDGKVVVEGGRVPGVDEEELAKQANEINQRWKEKAQFQTTPSFSNFDQVV